MKTYTPGPWFLTEDGVVADNAEVVADAERTLDCVRTCAGIPDPAEALRMAREALEFASVMMALPNETGVPVEIVRQIDAHNKNAARCRRALAALGGGK